VAPEVQVFAEKYALDPVDLSLYGGEEYELVVTVKPELWDRAREVLSGFKTPLIRIGKVIEEEEIKVRINGETKVVEGMGWEHFRSAA
jgi:thiamine-monophosphate kinase